MSCLGTYLRVARLLCQKASCGRGKDLAGASSGMPWYLMPSRADRSDVSVSIKEIFNEDVKQNCIPLVLGMLLPEGRIAATT